MTNQTNTSVENDPTANKAREEAGKAGETIAAEAKAVAGQAKELGREHAERQFEQGKHTVEEQVGAVSSAVDDAAQRLRRENNPLASYAEELSGQLSRFSNGIENTSLDDLAVKTRRVARDNPGLFMLGSVVAGLAAARFFKASAEKERSDGHGYSDYASDDGYRSPTATIRQPYRGSDGAATGTVSSTAGTAGDRVPVGGATGGGGYASGGSGTTGTTGAGSSASTTGTTSAPASASVSGAGPGATGSGVTGNKGVN